MSIIRLVGVCLLIGAVTSTLGETSDDVISKAQRLVGLRDRILSDHGAWAEEYAREDTEFARTQMKEIGAFAKLVNADTEAPDSAGAQAALSDEQNASRIVVVSVSALKGPDFGGSDNTRAVLKLSTGELHEGPDDLMRVASEDEDVLKRLVAEKVRAVGDFAILENTVLIPSGRYAVLGKGSLDYFADVDLGDQVKDGDFECFIEFGEVLLIETVEKRYALLEMVGGYKGQALVCFAYQPNGSAVFRFGRMPKPTELRGKMSELDPIALGMGMYLQKREIFLTSAVRDLDGLLQAMAEDTVRRTEAEREAARGLMRKLGLAE